MTVIWIGEKGNGSWGVEGIGKFRVRKRRGSQCWRGLHGSPVKLQSAEVARLRQGRGQLCGSRPVERLGPPKADDIEEVLFVQTWLGSKQQSRDESGEGERGRCARKRKG
jgi:hypothetical protein